MEADGLGVASALVLVALGAATALGCTTARALLPRWSAGGHALERLGFGYALGLGLVGLGLLLTSCLGLPLTRTTAVLMLVALLPAAVAARAASRSAPRAATDPAAPGALVWRWLLILLVLPFVMLVAWASVLHGASFPDAQSIWLLKAQVVFVDEGFGGRYFDAWQDGHDRRGYPPLLSLMASWLYALLGRADHQAVKLLWVGFWLAQATLVHRVLRERVSGLATRTATLAVLAAPAVVSVTLWGVADLPVAAYGMAALAVALQQQPRGRSPRADLAFGLLLACAAMTKNEGAVLAASLTLGVVLRGAPDADPHEPRPWTRRLGAGLRRALTLAWPALAATLGWRAWLMLRGVGGTAVMPAPADAAPAWGEHAGLVLDAALRQGAASSWLFVWPAVVVGLAVGLLRAWRGRLSATLSDACLAGGVVLVQLLAYAAVYVSFPGDLDFLLTTTASRLPVHVWSLAVCALVLAAASVRAAAPRADALPGDAPHP